MRKPHGLVEDVIFRIEDCYFPADFLVLDMKMTKELSQAPIILGRLFLATAKAITDWGKGEVILKVGEHTVVLWRIMCDTLDYAVGAVLGKRLDKKSKAICYASKTLIKAQINYTTTEKELLAVVYTLEKFRPYILGSKIIIYNNHATLKYLLSKKEA